jgi:iron-sulfur cluster insertion protein
MNEMSPIDNAAASGATVALSDSAARRIAELAAAEDQPGLMLRVAVTGGGCSGFQYNFAFDDARADDDLVIEKLGATVLVDTVSLGFLTGSEIDFVEDMLGSSFSVKNPNATSSCGCGSSFAV